MRLLPALVVCWAAFWPLGALLDAGLSSREVGVSYDPIPTSTPYDYCQDWQTYLGTIRHDC